MMITTIHHCIHVIACDYSTFVYTYMGICLYVYLQEGACECYGVPNISESMDAHSDFVGPTVFRSH